MMGADDYVILLRKHPTVVSSLYLSLFCFVINLHLFDGVPVSST